MVITKKEIVLDIFEGIDHAISNVIVFVYRDEDTGFMRHTVTMPRVEWNDLGCPMQITITVLPGDQLNKEG